MLILYIRYMYYPIYKSIFDEIWWVLTVSRRSAELIIYVYIHGHQKYIFHIDLIRQVHLLVRYNLNSLSCHDDVIKWKHFPRNWPFVRGIHRSPVNSPHKGQWRGALMFTLICARIYGWVNTREAGDLRRYRLHYDVIVIAWGLFP